MSTWQRIRNMEETVEDGMLLPHEVPLFINLLEGELQRCILKDDPIGEVLVGTVELEMMAFVRTVRAM